MFVVAPANLGDANATTPRLDRILKLGEITTRLAGAGKAFAAKFFPGVGDPVDVEALPELLEKATQRHDDKLRSAARGGAKVALALTAAWYPDADIRQLTEFMPTEDDNDQPIDVAQVLASVQGYATRVANMVDIRKFYKEHPDPHLVDPNLGGSRGRGGRRQPRGWRSAAPRMAKPAPKMPAPATKTPSVLQLLRQSSPVIASTNILH